MKQKIIVTDTIYIYLQIRRASSVRHRQTTRARSYQRQRQQRHRQRHQTNGRIRRRRRLLRLLIRHPRSATAAEELEALTRRYRVVHFLIRARLLLIIQRPNPYPFQRVRFYIISIITSHINRNV